MADKGARAELEPLVRQTYIDTGNLTLAAETHGVSRQTASAWKARTKRPNEDLDEWDKAREKKRSRIDRLRSMFDEQLEAMEALSALQRDSRMMDTLAKLGALIERWEGMATKAREQAADQAVQEIKRAGVTDELAETIRGKILCAK